MGIAEIMSAQCETIATAMGEAVTHTDADGADTSITAATFSEDPPELAGATDGKATIRRATCTIAAADVAAPARGETITRGSTIWTIEAEPLSVGGGDYWQLALKRTDTAEKSRQDYRIARG